MVRRCCDMEIPLLLKEIWLSEDDVLVYLASGYLTAVFNDNIVQHMLMNNYLLAHS